MGKEQAEGREGQAGRRAAEGIKRKRRVCGCPSSEGRGECLNRRKRTFAGRAQVLHLFGSLFTSQHCRNSSLGSGHSRNFEGSLEQGNGLGAGTTAANNRDVASEPLGTSLHGLEEADNQQVYG